MKSTNYLPSNLTLCQKIKVFWWQLKQSREPDSVKAEGIFIVRQYMDYLTGYTPLGKDRPLTKAEAVQKLMSEKCKSLQEQVRFLGALKFAGML